MSILGVQTSTLTDHVLLTYQPLPSPSRLAITLKITFVRLPRGKCALCHQRRVRYQLQADTFAASDAVCGPCAGLRP